MKPTLATICLLILISPCILGQKAALEEYFSRLVENKQFNGSIMVQQDARVVFEETVGMADFAKQAPIRPSTAFPIASITKTITGTAILQLVQNGKIAVSDGVSKYLPAFPYPDVTVRHLMSHTSGLPPYNAYLDSIWNAHPDTSFINADLLNAMVANPKPLIYKPGEHGNYDNINFLVLALIVEKVSGMPYQDYIKRSVLQPANMTKTVFIPGKMQYSRPADFPFAYPYLYPYKYSDSIIKAQEAPFISKYWSAYNFSGFGDGVSTVQDLIRYDMAYYNGSLLNDYTLNDAFTPVKLNNGQNNPGNFGLAWEIGSDTSLGKLIYHGGNATGLSCMLLRNITKHQTIVVFDNIHNNNSRGIAFDMMKILNGVKVPLPRKSVAKEYARTLLAQGPKAAEERLMLLKSDSLHYQVDENEMNDIGYDLMGGPNNPNPFRFPESRKYPEALEILRLNAELFPNSWNTHDSYGEILLLVGRKKDAIREYKKSVELNPNNNGGKKALEELQAKK